MNPQTMFAQPIFPVIGWALLHSLWQGALAALLYAAVSGLLKHSAASARYVLACAALAATFVLPLATVCLLLHSAQSAPAGTGAFTGRLLRGTTSTRQGAEMKTPDSLRDARGDAIPTESSTTVFQSWAADQLDSALRRLVMVWLCGVALFLLRFAAGLFGVRRLRRASLPLAGEWQRKAARLSERLRVSRTVKLCVSALVEVPTVVGWLRPILIIPASAFVGLTPIQLEALLAHELAHVRRYDYLVNFLQTAIETLMFYHPAAWWLSRRVRVEREHACDDLAVSATGDVLTYARALTQLEIIRRRRRTHALAIAANGGSLMQRIQRLVNAGTPSRRQRPPVVACAALVLLICGMLAGAQALVLPAGGKLAPDGAQRTAKRARREVAVTFVNFPANNIYDDGRLVNKTRKLMRSLASNKIEAVAFVNEGRLYKDGSVDAARVGLLREWLDAGHELGNETYAHTSLYRASQSDFQAEVLRGEKIISELARERGHRLRYFSYPYLNTGSTPEAKAETEKFLRERGYQIHPVTIDNMDWLFSHAYIEALRREDNAAADRIRAEYIPYMERMFEFYEEYSREVVGREIPQVLMLTAGALNADSFDDLAAMIKRRGYSFVTMERATKDEAYNLPDTYTGESGDSWIARWAVTKGMEYKDTEQVYLPAQMQGYYAELKKTWADKAANKK